MARPPLALALLLAAALLPGCAAPAAPGFAWHEQSERAILGNLPGLEVDGRLYGQGRSLHVEATAHNNGPHYYDLDAGCNTPWVSELTARVPGAPPEGRSTHPYKHVGCGAMLDSGGAAGAPDRAETDIFGPGEDRTFSIDWNGTLWDNAHGDDAFIRAPPGVYSWTLWFDAVGPCEPTCQEVGMMRLDFVVVVP